MRKVFGFLAIAFIMTCAVQSVYALGVGISTLTARIQFTSTGTFAWTVDLKNYSNHAATNTITWSNVTVGTTKWKNADQYALVNSTITSSSAYIRIYTDNKNSTAFKYTGTLTEGVGGLVGTGNTAAAPLPMSWTMRASTSVFISTITLNPDDTSTATGYNSSYFIDKALGDVFNSTTNVSYSTMLKNSGFKYGPAPTEYGGSGTGQSYLFFGANFATANTPNTYGCDRIIVQGINE